MILFHVLQRQHSIPRNLSYIINLKQSILILGLGAEEFSSAVCGLPAVYQTFQQHITHLHPWETVWHGEDLVIKVSNCYLTRAQDANGETGLDLAEIVDPFNVLHPHLQSEIHTADNAVQYWERITSKSGTM